MHHGYMHYGYMYHIMDTSVWVPRPDPKAAKDEVKEARRAVD